MMGISEPENDALSCALLDPLMPAEGPYNARWHLRMNHSSAPT
jgi:predicted transcriptional regulator of viral defense system